MMSQSPDTPEALRVAAAEFEVNLVCFLVLAPLILPHNTDNTSSIWKVNCLDHLQSLRISIYSISFVYCFTVIVASLATYEYIITIPQEVMYAWSRAPTSKWTLVKWMYLTQRYLPLVDATTLILYSSLFIYL